MSMVFVKNITDKDVCLWWGHTPYSIAAGCFEHVPQDAYEVGIKHKDYKGKLFQCDPGGDLLEEGKPKDPEPEVPKPWDNVDWDPMAADMDELKGYAAAKNIIIANDTSLSDAQQIVIEHFIS